MIDHMDIATAPAIPVRLTHILLPIFASTGETTLTVRRTASNLYLTNIAGVAPSSVGPAMLAAIAQALQRYHLRGNAEVIGFLVHHPVVVSPLQEASADLEWRFPGSPIYLELIEDEEDQVRSYLRVSIATDLDRAQAVARLKDFDDSWWLDSSLFQTGMVLFTLE